MLKKRILASSMASVMALTSMASVAVTAFADDTNADVKDAQADSAKLGDYIKEVESDVKIANYGSITQDKYKRALEYAKAHQNSSDLKITTVAYQMLKGVVDNLGEPKTKADLESLIASVRSIVDGNNENGSSELSDDHPYSEESFNDLVDAYNAALNARNRNSKDINDAYEELDKAKTKLSSNTSVTKSEFNSKYRAYQAALRKLGNYETWRRGEVKSTDDIDAGAYNGLKTTWGALWNHINSSADTIDAEYKLFTDQKGLNSTYSTEIVDAYKDIVKATNVLNAFVPDNVEASSQRDLDNLVNEYKGRILWSTQAGVDAVNAIVNAITAANDNLSKKIEKVDGDALAVPSATSYGVWKIEGSDTINDSTKVNGDDPVGDPNAIKLLDAKATVKCDAVWGLVYDTTNGWQVVADGVPSVVKFDGTTTAVTAGNISSIINEYKKKANTDNGSRGFSFRRGETVDLADIVDLPVSATQDYAKVTSASDPLSADCDAYVTAFDLSAANSLFNGTVQGIYSMVTSNEEYNEYADTKFTNGIRKPDDLIKSCQLNEAADIANSGSNYGVAPNVNTALVLWNTYMKSSGIVRGTETRGDNKTERENRLGKAGLSTAIRYNGTTVNDASLVGINERTVSAAEYSMVYRYMKYAFADAFDASGKETHTYKQLNDDLVETSYQIFADTTAELFTKSHNNLETLRRDAVRSVASSRPAGAYTSKLNDADETLYDDLKKAIETLQKEYDNFNLSFQQVYDLINEGAKAVDNGQKGVTAEAVSDLAKALIYVDPLIDADTSDEADIDNNPFSDDNKTFIGYNRLYTATDDDTHTVAREDGDIKFDKKSVNKSHNDVLLAYNALKAQLDGTAVSTVKGDADGDGKISAKDATAILKHVAKTETLNEAGEKNADVNGDGKVTAADATAILKHVAKIELIG